MEEVQTQKPFFENTPGLSSGEESLPFLSARNIVKKFPGTLALDKVSIDIYPREIHALLGENGAGKSTLIKMLSGAYTPDAGTRTIDGKNIDVMTPRSAMKLGIQTIYQEHNLYPLLSVYENLFAGNEKGK